MVVSHFLTAVYVGERRQKSMEEAVSLPSPGEGREKKDWAFPLRPRPEKSRHSHYTARKKKKVINF